MRRQAPRPRWAAGRTPVPEARRFTVGVGLKMYMGHARATQWMEQVAELGRTHPGVADGSIELFALPSFVSLVEGARILRPAGVAIGAQDLSWADAGAFTGEVSGAELAEVGCTLVEVGHAERINLLGESGEMIGAKVEAAFRNGLVPIVCVGESSEQAPADAAQVCTDQLNAYLSAARTADVVGRIVLAYEPQWAIGAPQPAQPPYIREVCGRLREVLDGDPAVSGSALIYGGSAGPGLLDSLDGTVDGLFLGRSAHDPAALRAVLDELVALKV